MLQADPAERITVSEIFNHSWVRTASSTHFVDLFHQFQQQQQQQQQTAVSPMVSGFTTPAAGLDSVASSLSPSLKVRCSYFDELMLKPTVFIDKCTCTQVRKGGPTAALLETIPPADQLSVLMPTEEPMHYDALRSHLATPPSTSPTSTSSKHHTTGGIFSSPTPTTMASGGGTHTGSLPFSTSNGSLASLSPVPLYPSRRRSRTKDALGSGGNGLTSSSGNDLASLDLSPRPNLSPQNSGDRSSLGSTDGSHSSGGTNGSTGNGNGNGHSKSTIKLIPLRRNNSNVASHQNSNSDLLGSGSGSNGAKDYHSHGSGNSSNGGHGSSAAVAQLLHHEHTELPSLTQRLSNGASHAMGIAQLLGVSSTAGNGGSNNNHYNNNVGDDSSVVSTASAPSSQPPRGINRPSTVNASNRGRNIINSIVKEEDPTIVSPTAAPPSTSSTLESPYGSRKYPGGARKATSSASSSNAPTSTSGAGNVTGATLSSAAANKFDAVGGTKRAASAVPSHATSSSSTSGSKDAPHRSATVPPMLGAIGAQRSQTSMSSSNLTASTSPRPPVGSSGMGHTHHHHVDDTVIPGLAMNTDSHLHHQPYHPSTSMSATARTAVTKPFNTVGTVTSTGKTRFL